MATPTCQDLDLDVEEVAPSPDEITPKVAILGGCIYGGEKVQNPPIFQKKERLDKQESAPNTYIVTVVCFWEFVW